MTMTRRANDPTFWLRECMEREASLEDAREAGKDVERYEVPVECARLGLELTSGERLEALEEATEQARRVYAPLEER